MNVLLISHLTWAPGIVTFPLFPCGHILLDIFRQKNIQSSLRLCANLYSYHKHETHALHIGGTQVVN